MKLIKVIKKPLISLIAISMIMMNVNMNVYATYYTEEEYNNIENAIFNEDRGVVLENYPELGYMIYKNNDGVEIQAPYYTSQLVVEKQDIHEIEDRVGYIDELFPYFEYDPRDTTIENVVAGDSIYVRKDKDGYITYISAYCDYMLRYGKVKSWQIMDNEKGRLEIEDEKGQIFVYEVKLSTFVTKANRPLGITNIKIGEWVKLLVSQQILGEGIINEEIKEIVVDADTRVISDVYKGEVMKVGSYDNTLRLARAQALNKNGWGSFVDILTLSADPRNFNAFMNGDRISWDYIGKYLTGSASKAYVAVEEFMGKQNVAKMSVTDEFQKTLSPSQVIYQGVGELKLLSGENLTYAEDSIIIKDDRLVDPHNIMVGEVIQTVVTGDNKISIAKVVDEIESGNLQIFRGRIKKIEDREYFVVETFSLLENNEWYYHPQPRTFSIDYDTKFFDEEGFVENGVEEFLGYGANSQISKVYTIVASGEQALVVADIPYTRESVKGELYKTEDDMLYLKDVYYYNVDENRWFLYSEKNIGITTTLNPNTIIIKDGKQVNIEDLEAGDKLSVMLEEELKSYLGDEDDDKEEEELVDVPGYILIVE